jgi:hypothetical protein
VLFDQYHVATLNTASSAPHATFERSSTLFYGLRRAATGMARKAAPYTSNGVLPNSPGAFDSIRRNRLLKIDLSEILDPSQVERHHFRA